MTAIKDWRGTPIEVGDVILYAVKHSTWVEVNEAIVKSVGEEESEWHTKPIPVVRCEWQTSSYSYRPGGTRFSSERMIKNVKLTNFEGLTVVAKATPPAFSRVRHEIKWAVGANLRMEVSSVSLSVHYDFTDIVSGHNAYLLRGLRN